MPFSLPTLRAAALNLLLLAGSFLVTVLVLEWLLRFTNIQRVPALNPPIYQVSESADISYELIPSIAMAAYGTTITTNSLGFRSPEIDPKKPLLVMLGDSTTFGQGVGDTETIAAYLQKLLPDQFVLNTGVSGYNIGQETATFSAKVLPLEPKTLVLIFVYNDFDEANILGPDGYLYPKSKPPTAATAHDVALAKSINKPGTIPIPFKYFLQTHSAVFTFIERVTKGLSFRSPGASENIFSDPVTDSQLKAYRVELHRLASASSIPKLFVIWPEPNLHLNTRSKLAAIAEAEGFRVLDLYQIYGNNYPSLGWDGHANASTNKRTAALLAEALRHFGLLR